MPKNGTGEKTCTINPELLLLGIVTIIGGAALVVAAFDPIIQSAVGFYGVDLAVSEAFGREYDK